MIPTRGIARTPAALLLLLGLLPIACSGPGPTVIPVEPTARPTVSVTEPEPATSAETTPELPGQSESVFGTIWNAVPDSFPIPEDAAEADPPQQGPVSGAWAVSVAFMSAPELAGFYNDALDDIGWGTVLDGPLEDGSYTVYSSNGYGCETLTTVLPRGDESLVTALFGAGCPWR